MKVKLTVNPLAGKGKGERYGKIVERLARKNGIELVQQGFEYQMVVGGDGTVHGVVNNPGGIDTPMILIPSGVGNDFAHAQGIPEDPKKAFHITLRGKPRTVDLIEVNGEYVATVASFGFDAKVNQLALRLKQKCWFLPTKMMYAVALLWELLFHFECFQIEVKTQGTVLRENVILVAVANVSPYAQIFNIAPGADPSDGLLDVCLIRQANRQWVLKNLFRVVRGTHVSLPEVETCQMDGETLPAEQEYQISIHQGALKVLVP